jgi:hypothetical protein
MCGRILGGRLQLVGAGWSHPRWCILGNLVYNRNVLEISLQVRGLCQLAIPNGMAVYDGDSADNTLVGSPAKIGA